ncbi:Uncharacterized protein TCM_033422 [Theobroma cacao]|uniref:Protein kinase domain-containing protein n=1 Tax=Theobroma cacao TaxID=3641 RepID=A0A061FBP6_THECC|nr:Uncharacterized protein TCM_033422 [Theobroma cacao]
MLNFYDNPFIDGKLPISIGNLSISLEELDASHCNIRGNIPREIGNLINLINLYIANNALIGTIPTTIKRLEKFQRLSLEDNTLEGSIQFELCHLKNLGYLYLIGSFGSVYQGTFSDGLNIVIKVFNLEVKGSFKSFGVECDFLRNICHGSLVTIISNCCNVDFKALILEFMPNGSLEKWLYSHNYFPDIFLRLNIMIDVASPFDYFYHGDFGIAKLLGEKDSKLQTITLATIGYMASEYETQGVVSIKSDAYSFGILLIETLTRKKPTDEMFVGEMSLKHWVIESLPSALTQVVNANFLISTKEQEHFAIKDCALSSLQLALECSKKLPEEGIDMKNVIAKLKKIKIKFLKDLNKQA